MPENEYLAAVANIIEAEFGGSLPAGGQRSYSHIEAVTQPRPKTPLHIERAPPRRRPLKINKNNENQIIGKSSN